MSEEQREVHKEHIVKELERLLHYHKLLGIEDYPTTEAVRDFLLFADGFSFKNGDGSVSAAPSPMGSVQSTAPFRSQSKPQLAPQTCEQQQDISPRARTTPVEASSVPAPTKPSMSVSVIAAVDVRNLEDLCVSCSLKPRGKMFIPGRGGDRVRLLVVGGWLIHNAEANNEKSVFGVEEDLMLARMFAAMNLSPNEVMVTNMVKCCLERGELPTDEEKACCYRLLQKQIIDLKPEIICAMGTLAAQTLLQKTRSLSQLRGNFYQTEVAPGLSIPVFATYHPSYLVQNEEMKRPTWEDLQKIVRRLNSKKASSLS